MTENGTLAAVDLACRRGISLQAARKLLAQGETFAPGPVLQSSVSPPATDVAGGAADQPSAGGDGEAPGRRLPPRSLSPHDPVGCRWIEGEPGHGPWRYCQHDQQPGSDYCPLHHARSWKAAKGDAA